MIKSMRQVGGSLGIAIMGAIVATSVSVSPLDPRHGEEFVPGYRALQVGAAILLAGAVIAVVTVRKTRPAEQVAVEPAVGA